MPHVGTEEQAVLTAKIIAKEPDVNLVFELQEAGFVEFEVHVGHSVDQAFDEVRFEGGVEQEILEAAEPVTVAHDARPQAADDYSVAVIVAVFFQYGKVKIIVVWPGMIQDVLFCLGVFERSLYGFID